MALVWLAAFVLLEGAPPGHPAEDFDVKELALHHTAGKTRRGSSLFPDALPDPRPIAMAPDTRGSSQRSGVRLIACAEDRTNAAAATGYWTKGLKHNNPQFRALAAKALGEMRDATATPALVEALKDVSEDVRLSAVQALGRIGPGATAAIPALLEALNDTRPDIRSEITSALEKIREAR